MFIGSSDQSRGLRYVGVKEMPSDIGGVGSLRISKKGHFGSIRGEDVEFQRQPCCLGSVH